MHLSPASVWGLRGWNREELSSAPLIVSSKKRQGTRHFSDINKSTFLHQEYEIPCTKLTVLHSSFQLFPISPSPPSPPIPPFWLPLSQHAPGAVRSQVCKKSVSISTRGAIHGPLQMPRPPKLPPDEAYGWSCHAFKKNKHAAKMMIFQKFRGEFLTISHCLRKLSPKKLSKTKWIESLKTDLKPSLRKDPKLDTEPTRALRKEHATEVKACEIKAAMLPTTTYFWTKQLLCDHTTPLLGGSRKCLDQESIFKLISTLKKPNRENLGKASVLQSHTWRRPLQPAWRGLLVPGPVMATGWS